MGLKSTQGIQIPGTEIISLRTPTQWHVWFAIPTHCYKSINKIQMKRKPFKQTNLLKQLQEPNVAAANTFRSAAVTARFSLA